MLEIFAEPTQTPKRSKRATSSKKAPTAAKKLYFTGADLANSPIVGVWKDRTDIDDSTEFVRGMREHEQ